MSQDASQPVAVTEQQFISIFKYLMRRYAEDKELDTKQMRSVTIRDLVTFCTAVNLPICDSDEIVATLKVPVEAIDFVWKVFQDPFASCQILQPIWPTLILSGQPPIKHQPAAFIVSVTAAFADNHVLQMQAQTPWNPNKPLTDGFLCALLLSQMNSLVQTIGEQGLDQLYVRFAQDLGERLDGTVKKVVVEGSPTMTPGPVQEAQDSAPDQGTEAKDGSP